MTMQCDLAHFINVADCLKNDRFFSPMIFMM